MVNMNMGSFDGFTLRAGIFFEEEESSVRGCQQSRVQGSGKLRRAIALHMTKSPQRWGSQNEWGIHILRLKEAGQLAAQCRTG